MRSALLLLPLLVLVGSCKSPPRPPTVDEATKRPANSAAAIQLQACRSDLQNTRILLNESVRSAEAARTVVTQLERRSAVAEEVTDEAQQRNTLYVMLFAFGSARVDLGDPGATRLIEQARRAPLVLLRGRTDGSTPTAAEIRVARERAAAVQAWLVRAGVEPARIRLTWQPTGDHAADNSLPGGRTLNRRVEIEIYHAAPEIVALNQASDHAAVQTRQPPLSPSGDKYGH